MYEYPLSYVFSAEADVVGADEVQIITVDNTNTAIFLVIHLTFIIPFYDNTYLRVISPIVIAFCGKQLLYGSSFLHTNK